MRVTRITLRPRIIVRDPADGDRVRRLVRIAHERCYIANSLRSEVVVEPRIEAKRGPGGNRGC